MKRLWFRSKRYGLGWYPVSWEGWLVILGYVGCVLLVALRFEMEAPVWYVITGFILRVAVLTLILIWICYRTGEKLSWQWGSTKEEPPKP